MNKKLRKNIIKLSPPILIDFLENTQEYYFFRQYNNETRKNTELKSLHKNKRCFILGSGPSIKKQDLKLLKDEVVISLNNFFVHPDFNEFMISDTVAKYHLTPPIHPPQTKEEWGNWFDAMNKAMPPNVTLLLGLSKDRMSIKRIFNECNFFDNFNINWYYAGYKFDIDTKYNKKLIDFSKPVWRSRTASVYALSWAIYMGFETVYLLGTDHDYFIHDNPADMRMYKEAIHQKNEIKRTFGDRFYIEEFARQFDIFNQYYILNSNKQTKIYNASPNSLLKVFPFVDYNEIVNS